MSSFSVTKVRVAFECPRLFYLGHQFGGKTQFKAPQKSFGIGVPFHHLAEEFIALSLQDSRFQKLFEPLPEELQADLIAKQMQTFFYETIFFPYIQKINKDENQKQQDFQKIWQAFEKIIKKWTSPLIANRNYCAPKKLFRKTFIIEEYSLKHTFILPDSSQKNVIGRLDSLIFNFEKNRLCVVDYKTYEPVDLSGQLAQVALYSYMLYKQKGVLVDAAVYSVFPEFKEYNYPWERLEKRIHELIPHKLQQMQQWLTWEPPQLNPPPPTTHLNLCDHCPQKKKCQALFKTIQSP
jgi:S-DNA-T family DNA segregation ATPase FtsK/SpoIIIE